MSLATKLLLTILLLYTTTHVWRKYFVLKHPSQALVLVVGLWSMGTALISLIWLIWLIWTWI